MTPVTPTPAPGLSHAFRAIWRGLVLMPVQIFGHYCYTAGVGDVDYHVYRWRNRWYAVPPAGGTPHYQPAALGMEEQDNG